MCVSTYCVRGLLILVLFFILAGGGGGGNGLRDRKPESLMPRAEQSRNARNDSVYLHY